MKLIFKYRFVEDWFSKGYVKECESFEIPNEISINLDSESYLNMLKKDEILNEVYLSNYLCDTDISLVKFVLDKLNNKDINDYDISSQGWDVELEKEKVIISQIYSSGEKRKAYINREEVSYAMLKWKNFLEREIDNPEYQEIIDTEEVYKNER